MSDVDEALAALAAGATNVKQALSAIAAGRMVIVVGESGAGDLVASARQVTPETIAFMTRQGGGWICLALSADRCDQLRLAPMAPNEAADGPPFTVTIEAREGVSTGISAHDQARTMRVATDPAAGRAELTVPGHVQPLRAAPGGVLEHPGRAETAVDLAALAGAGAAGVICQIQRADGSLAGPADLAAYAARHHLPLVRAADIVEERRRREPLVQRVATARMPTAFGVFTAVGFRGTLDAAEHVALVKGEISGQGPVPVHVQAACLTGTAFHTLHCSCGARLDAALAAAETEGSGVVVHLADTRGLLEQLRRHRGAHAQDDAVAAQILASLGVRSVRLVHADPRLAAGLERHGVRVAPARAAGDDAGAAGAARRLLQAV